MYLSALPATPAGRAATSDSARTRIRGRRRNVRFDDDDKPCGRRRTRQPVSNGHLVDALERS